MRYGLSLREWEGGMALHGNGRFQDDVRASKQVTESYRKGKWIGNEQESSWPVADDYR